MEKEYIDHLFTYHPSQNKVPLFETITNGTKELAHIYNENVPDGTDKELALHYLRLARMMANAAIACEQRYGE